MSGEIIAGYDPEAPPGQRLPPEMREEIALLAPASVTPNSITKEKIADEAVGTLKLEPKAVDSTRLADGAVGGPQLALGAVGSNQLAGGAVTGPKAGNGVAKAYDPAGAAIAMTIVPISEAQYAQISPDPNTVYLLYSG